MGFRDCISEVSSFFKSTDDTQNPMYLHLISHLQYFTGGHNNQHTTEVVVEDTSPTTSKTEVANPLNFLLDYQAFLFTLAQSLCDQQQIHFV